MKIAINGFLRVLSILPKLYLSFYLLRVWTLDDIGKFNLLSTTITILILIIGLDFYNYSNRELVNSDNQLVKGEILLRQIVFYFCIYSLLLPILYLLLRRFLPLGELEIYFFIILICEHLSQEIYRILNILKFQITASILLAVRNTLWICIFFVTFFFNNETEVTFSILFKSWAVGTTICTIFSFLILNSKINFKDFFFSYKRTFDFYRKSTKVVGIYFLITILYKLLEYSGRYILNIYFDPKVLGVYSIFYQISNLMTLFIDSTIIAFLYPKLLSCLQENDFKSFRVEVVNSTFKILLFGLAFIGVFYILSDEVYTFIGKTELKNYDSLLLIILFSNLIYSLSFVYHYALYSMQKDKSIFYSVIFSFILYLSTSVFIMYFNIYGVALGGFISYSGLFFSKYFIYKNKFVLHIKKNEK